MNVNDIKNTTKRIESLKTDLQRGGWWSGSVSDLAFMKEAFQQLAKQNELVRENKVAVRELSDVLVTKVASDLEWPWIRKVASAIWRIFSGGVSQPHAFLGVMTESQIDALFRKLGDKVDPIIEKQYRGNRIKALQHVKDQVTDVINDLSPEYKTKLKDSIFVVESKIQTAIDELVYQTIEEDYHKIWSLYPEDSGKVHEKRNKDLLDLNYLLDTKKKEWRSRSYLVQRKEKNPFEKCRILQQAIETSIDWSAKQSMDGARKTLEQLGYFD